MDKFAVEEAILLITAGSAGRFHIPGLVDVLEKQGFDFGEGGELIQAAKYQKTRILISQIRDKNGKRKYVSTSSHKGQTALDFGAEFLYCSAETATTKKEDNQSLNFLLIKRVLGNLRRCPSVPEWVVKEITTVLEKWSKAG